MPKEKGEASGEAGTKNPDSSPPEQTAFQHFGEFARRVVSVPKAEIDERERTYRYQRKRTKLSGQDDPEQT